MQVNNGKDFWAGLLYAGFGAMFFIVARNYNMGSALRMGPAYFPTVLGGLLFLLGLATFIRSFKSKIHHPFAIFPFNIKFFIAALIIAVPAYIFQKDMYEIGGQWMVWIVDGAGILVFFMAWGTRSLWQILICTILFGYLLRSTGLVITTFILIFGAALAGDWEEFKFKEVLIMAIVLSAGTSLAFVKGLGLPFPIWPDFIMGY